jgi:hypothetical protein
MLLVTELLILLVILIKLEQSVILMLFLVALVGIQVHHLFQIAQQTHHQELQLVLLAVALMALGVVVKTCTLEEEYSIEQEHVLEQTVLHTLRLTQGPAACHSVELGVLGEL